MSQIITQRTASVTPGTYVQTLTGNSGGAVPPSAGGNINVLGAGTVTVTGTPVSNTLTISLSGTTVLSYTNVTTTPYVATVTDNFLSVDTSSLAITIQLPNAATLGRSFTIKDRTGAAATRNITVTTVGGAVNIDGATTFVMNTNYQSVQVLGNGSTYEIY